MMHSQPSYSMGVYPIWHIFALRSISLHCTSVSAEERLHLQSGFLAKSYKTEYTCEAEIVQFLT